MRLIDADALKEQIKNLVFERFTLADWYEPYLRGCVEIEAMIDVAPTIESRATKHGKWHSRYYHRKASNSYDCEVFVCGECQAEFSYDAESGVRASDYHYCPHCGAKMDLEGEAHETD